MVDRVDRWHRAGAVTMTAVGALLLAGGAAAMAASLPDLLRAESGHMAGDATAWLLFVALPMAFGGVLALIAAWLLWQGRTSGDVLAIAWVATAALACLVTVSGWGNSLAAIRMFVLESGGSWSFAWPELGVRSADGAMYYARIDDWTFWLPLVAALGAVMLAVCLVGSAIARGRAGTHHVA